MPILLSVSLEYVSAKKESKFLLALLNSLEIKTSFFIKVIKGPTVLVTHRIDSLISRTQYKGERAKSESI